MNTQNSNRGGLNGQPHLLKRWTSFFVGLYLIYIFAFSFLPFMSNFLGFRQAHNLIIEEKIEAGAWFYIAVEKIRDIELEVRGTMEHTPGKGQSK